MKKNRRNNSRPAAIATAKDTTKAIETRAGVLKEAEDVKKEAKTSFYLQYMGKENKSRKRIYNSCSCGRCDFQGGFIPDKESIQGKSGRPQISVRFL